MNTRSGRGEIRNFRILLDSGSSATILMDKMLSKNKQKQSPEESTWET